MNRFSGFTLEGVGRAGQEMELDEEIKPLSRVEYAHA